MAVESVTIDALHRFVHQPVDAIPDAVLNRAAILLADTLGVAIGSAAMDPARIARDAAHFHMNAPAPEAIPMAFDGRTASRSGAAFALATGIDNLDAHDGFNPVKGHIGCAVVPALVSAAHGNPELTGRDALAAMVVGYEIAARAGIVLHATACDFHTSGAWNGLGVVAMLARLSGMDSERIRHALGIAEYHGPRSQMMREIANPTMLHDGSGMGAFVGTLAHDMAKMGFTGAPAITVESDEVSETWDDLGMRWTLPENYIKPYPICRWAHAAIDAIRAVRLASDYAIEDITAIKVGTFSEGAALFPGMPETTSQAQYSLPFAVATMARFGKIGVAEITGKALNDEKTASLISRIELHEVDKYNDLFPDERWSDVTVCLSDGRALESGPIKTRGNQDTPLSTAEIREKFDTFCRDAIPQERVNDIWTAALSMTETDVRFQNLTDLLTAPTNGALR